MLRSEYLIVRLDYNGKDYLCSTNLVLTTSEKKGKHSENALMRMERDNHIR